MRDGLRLSHEGLNVLYLEFDADLRAVELRSPVGSSRSQSILVAFFGMEWRGFKMFQIRAILCHAPLGWTTNTVSDVKERCIFPK
jgi:hypothetical protein